MFLSRCLQSALKIQLHQFRKVSSYTLLNGSRLPWPLSYCFGSQALFRSTIPRDGAYYVAWRFIPYRQICLPKDSHWKRSLVSFSIVIFSNFPCPYPKVIVRWRIEGAIHSEKSYHLKRLGLKKANDNEIKTWIWLLPAPPVRGHGLILLQFHLQKPCYDFSFLWVSWITNRSLTSKDVGSNLNS